MNHRKFMGLENWEVNMYIIKSLKAKEKKKEMIAGAMPESGRWIHRKAGERKGAGYLPIWFIIWIITYWSMCFWVKFLNLSFLVYKMTLLIRFVY